MENDTGTQEITPEGSQEEEVVSVEDMDYDTLAQKYKEAAAQKNHWRDKAKKLEERQPQKQEPQPVAKIEEPNISPSREDPDWRPKIDFVTGKGRDLDAEEVTEVVNYAKGAGISYDDALETPMFKAYLKERQAQKRVENATPSASKKSAMVNGKNFHTMSSAEKQANFQQFVQSRIGK